MPPSSDRKVLKPSEVCERLRISSDKLHAMIAAGELSAIKLGPRTTRIYADSVDALVERSAAHG